LASHLEGPAQVAKGQYGTGVPGIGEKHEAHAAGPGRDPIDDCVHCGFCLPHCPTYQNWGEEMDSPRGRIDLMRGLREGKIELNQTVAGHFDKCLGCMACVTACPSGVKYDVLIEETRAQLERDYPRPAGEAFFRNALFSLLPYPRRLKVMAFFLWLYAASGLQRLLRAVGIIKALPARMQAMEANAPSMTWAQVTSTLPERVAAQGEQRASAGLIAGCVQRVFFPGVNEATLRVLSAEGFAVAVPKDQGCCGALSMHAGREDESLRFARALIETFEGCETIVVNAAGCGSHLKDYGRLFTHDEQWAARAKAFAAKVRDVHEVLAPLEPRAKRNPIPMKIAYHDACHLAHAQRIRSQPRQLLAGIPGLVLCEIADGEQCCGSAGIYNLVQPESARQVGARKVDNVLAAGADLVASGNPGCTLQIEQILRARGKTMPSAHPIEILDASIRGVKP
jgi:glycolate oxidase iron-sulfur subunit